MTLAEALKQATTRLMAEPLYAANAARDAEMLLMYALRIERVAVIAHPERLLTAREQTHFASLVQQRLMAMPIQYITGEQEFYGLKFRVGPEVLIPRPETEHLVEAVLERLPRNRAVTIADIGTGSGAIAVAVAHALPMAKVIAVDLSAAALDVAKENATRNGVAERIEFLQSDLMDKIVGRKLDAVVSNPPYIAFKERGEMHPQVRDHEPAQALFGGVTGLEVYERLIPQAWEALSAGGWLMMEMGIGQDVAIGQMLGEWKDVSFVLDLQGIKRVVVGRRQGKAGVREQGRSRMKIKDEGQK